MATPTDSPTGRNLATTRAVRLALGHTRDVIMIEGDVEVLEIDALPRERGDRFATRTGFDPRALATPYRWFRIRPRRMQAWREANELPDRELMRDGHWLPDAATNPFDHGLCSPATIVRPSAVHSPKENAMTTIASVTLETPDPTAADALCAALGVDTHVRVRASEASTTGLRGFALSLVVSQPSTVDTLLAAALDNGATTLKPAKKGFWGYGGAVQAPDETIWMVATSAKRDSGPATRQIDDIVLLLGVADVKASKRFYVDRGLTVAKSFGGKYVEFEAPASHVKLSLYGRRALAKQAGVSPDGTGSHRIVLGSDAEPFTDPDGFAWEAASQPAGQRTL